MLLRIKSANLNKRAYHLLSNYRWRSIQLTYFKIRKSSEKLPLSQKLSKEHLHYSVEFSFHCYKSSKMLVIEWWKKKVMLALSKVNCARDENMLQPIRECFQHFNYWSTQTNKGLHSGADLQSESLTKSMIIAKAKEKIEKYVKEPIGTQSEN